ANGTLESSSEDTDVAWPSGALEQTDLRPALARARRGTVEVAPARARGVSRAGALSALRRARVSRRRRRRHGSLTCSDRRRRLDAGRRDDRIAATVPLEDALVEHDGVLHASLAE